MNKRVQRFMLLLGCLWVMSVMPASAAQANVAGMRLAATCVNCHASLTDATGLVADKAFGDLSGWPKQIMLEQLQAYRRMPNKGPATVMHQLVKGYSEEELRMIADYFSSLPLPAKK